MKKIHNQKVFDTILKFNEIPINKYGYGDGITANFLDSAAAKYNLKTEKHKNKKITSIFYKNKEIAKMSGLRSASTSHAAYQLCKNKFKLSQYLGNMGLNTLESQYYNKDEYQKAYDFVLNNNVETFVIKPLNLAGGKGIQLDINKDKFKQAWENCLKAQSEEGITYPGCILQPYINGFDIRVTIIEGKYSAALLRLPAHVIGNGEQSIIELIHAKNEKRKTIAYFRNKLIATDTYLDTYLDYQGLSKDYVPKEKEIVLLSNISNLTFGGESIDITDILSKDIKELAINSAASIPGLYSTGIDIMAKDYSDGEGFVIEMNTSANLTMHHLPLKGNKRFPYNTFIRASLIKYKVLNNIRLTIGEEEFWSEVQKFMFLKDKFQVKTLSK